MTLRLGNKDVNKDMVGPRPTRSGGGLDQRGRGVIENKHSTESASAAPFVHISFQH
jgi:hypothetical protein